MNHNLFSLIFLQQTPVVIEDDVDKVSKGFETSWQKMWEKIWGWKDEFIEHLPEIIISLVVFLFCYILSVYVKRWIKKPLAGIIKRASIRTLVANVASGVIVLIGLLVSVSVLNLSDLLTGIVAAGGIAGLALALAFQGPLANTFSGIFISLNDVMNVGDYVETGNYAGNVEEITLRNTRIREIDNNIVVIPNKTIVETPFKNFALTPRTRVIIFGGVHYDSDLRNVKEISTEAIKSKFEQLAYENIEFHWLEFAESSINFQIRFWIEAKSILTITEAKSEAMMTLKEAFNEHNIKIPYPIRTIEIEGGRLT